MGNHKKPRRVKSSISQPEGKKGNGEKEWTQGLKNEKFEKYYKAQKLVAEQEWSQFMQYLRDPLPTTFRLAGSRETVHELNNIIRSVYVPQLNDVTFENEKVPPPTQISWYPEGLAWHLNVPKSALRRSPEFKQFHNFLVYETDVGNISRQEAVSMIPPLFLNVQSHHLVIDMCAAPGSKTAQLLEAMHAPSSVDEAFQIPSGLLIANDSDLKRTHLLVHQSSRLPSPALMITNLDASNYPNIALAASGSAPTNTLKFDRILCDVPCSGDGTLRKNIGIWGHWQPMDGNGLHNLQLRILLRAMKLLKPIGRIVYSTCSLNPVENEAVVAAALKAKPDFELVDVSADLPALIRKPGLEEWSPVVDKELTTFPSFSAYEDWKLRNSVNKDHQNQMSMTETHWPPKDVENLCLTRCLRIYPHLQDMGGFFIAILRRKSMDTAEALEHHEASNINGKRPASQDPDPAAPEVKKTKAEEFSVEPSPASLVTSTDASLITSNSKSKGNSSKKSKSEEKPNDATGKFKEPPYTYLASDHPQLRKTLERLSLLPSFPTSNIFVRHPEGGASTVPLRSMYLCNDIVKRVILANDYCRIRLVSAGTKIFTRQDAGGAASTDTETVMMRQQFRILGDAVPVLLPFVPPETILSGGLHELRVLLEKYYPLIGSFDEPFQSMIACEESGNHLVRFHTDKRDGAAFSHPIVLPLWRSNASVSLMIDKKSKSALSLRVFGEDITVAGLQHLEQQRKKQERRNAAAAAKEAKNAQDDISGRGQDTDNEVPCDGSNGD